MKRSSPPITRLFAELSVVFLGVYGAFMLDGCREERERQARRDQILDMLSEDFAVAETSMEQAQADFRKTFGRFLEDYPEGRRPALHPIPIPAFLAVDTWGAVLSAGGLDSLDVETIRQVEAVLAQISPMIAAAGEYNAYVREVLVPNLDLGEDEYYLDDGTLRPKYLWYWFSLRTLDLQIERLAIASGEIARHLRELGG